MNTPEKPKPAKLQPPARRPELDATNDFGDVDHIGTPLEFNTKGELVSGKPLQYPPKD